MIDTINAIINSTIDFFPFRFAETLNALYIRTISHIVSKRVKAINDTAITALLVDNLIGSPIFRNVQRMYFPNLSIESENPINDAIKYGKRARAWVPNISIALIEDGDATIAHK